MSIRDLMRSELVSILPHVPLEAAYTLMCEHGFHHFPVVNGKMELIGILSDRDIISCVMKRQKSDWSQILVQDVFTRAPVTMSPDDSPQEAAALMVARRISSLPIVEAGRLVGIITHIDLLRLLAEEPLS
jgi:acetoin utilization protein AcuB